MAVFSINHFAQMYAKKVGINASVLEKTLWGDYFLNAKSKRIFKGAQVCMTDNSSGRSLSPHSGQREEATLCTICTGEFMGSVRCSASK